jgi:predicted AlkP superfamily pyrophosphatase or phosphodiesterase
MRTSIRAAVAALLLLLAARPAESAPPRLVVVVVVDQMRADYVDWYGARWTGGLRRLYDQGAVLRNARYPYLNTLTCPGHFTISTGAYPHRHGMIANSWYDRTLRRMVDCTDDPAAALVSYPPGAPAEGNSARNAAVPTLAGAMHEQLQPKPRIAAFSHKARSAIALAAQAPGVVLWIEEGRWTTSSAFAPAPARWLESFLAANPVAGAPPVPLSEWLRSPAADEYLGRLVGAGVAGMKLGQGPGTDFLGVSFSMTDIIGHKFGPRSPEVERALLQVDASLGRLLEALDQQVGREHYVLAMSADHGVALLPEENRRAGKDAGRLIATDLEKQAEAALAAELGPGDLVAEVPGNDVYLVPGVHARLTAKPGALARVLRALRRIPGVAAAFDRSEVEHPARARDPRRKAAALSYYPGRSGDLVLVHKPNWVVGAAGSNHGSIHDYDRHVPVIFFGAGVKPGKYDRAASPADIAPTLARLLGVKLPHAEGRVLGEVLSAR